jgi:hypothetical protein
MNQVSGQFIKIESKENLNVFYEGNNPEIRFAASELKKYVNLAYGMKVSISRLESIQNKGAIILSISNKDVNIEKIDEFSIDIEEGNLIISGSNGRSVLYGVYKSLDLYIGYKWVNPECEYVPLKAPEIIYIQSKSYKADFPKRGIVLENSESPEYVLRIIDWMTKNNYNSIFFTFHLWESNKHLLREEIKKRGLLLTLGGHNIDMFLPSSRYFQENPEWFALYNENRIDTQPCFSSEEGTNTIIGNILEYCKNEKIINTICIWPNDNLYTCKCDKCVKSGFINTYIEFLDKLKRHAAKAGMKINIQHIAYNAQLEWEMLDTVPVNNDLDTLVACWGRDYTYGLNHPSNQYDIRFNKCIKNWIKACKENFGTRFSMFEYYGDYWMLTALFPPLIKKILKDVEFLMKSGADEITCLIVPFYLPEKIIHEELLNEKMPENPSQYEFNSERTVLWFNLYVLACKMWDCSASYSEIMQRYCSAYFGKEKNKAARLIRVLEKSLSVISSFNTRFFSLNFKTVWLRDNWLTSKTVSKRASSEIVKWEPENDNSSIPEERMKVCLDILKIMEPDIEEVTNIKEVNGNHYIDNFNNLKEYYVYIYKKIKSIYHQSAAQYGIIHSDYHTAEVELMSAIELENGINGWDGLYCNEWLEKVRNHMFYKEGGK